jgi:hypothetical protein
MRMRSIVKQRSVHFGISRRAAIHSPSSRSCPAHEPSGGVGASARAVLGRIKSESASKIMQNTRIPGVLRPRIGGIFVSFTASAAGSPS